MGNTGVKRLDQEGNPQLAVVPLDLLDDVQAAVQDKLILMAGLLGEAGVAVAALLGRPELVLEDGVVLGADDGKVVRHVWSPVNHRCRLVDVSLSFWRGGMAGIV